MSTTYYLEHNVITDVYNFVVEKYQDVELAKMILENLDESNYLRKEIARNGYLYSCELISDIETLCEYGHYHIVDEYDERFTFKEFKENVYCKPDPNTYI